MVRTKWRKRVLVVLIAQCRHPSPRRAPWYFYCRPFLCLNLFQGRGAFIRQGAFVREGHLEQTCQLRGALIRYEALIREKAFIRSFTVLIMDFCGKSWNLKTQWIVDQLWILARIPDCPCLGVRILSPKPEIWITDLSSAMVGMLMRPSKLFRFSHEAHLNSGPGHPYRFIFENGDFFHI